MNNNYITHCISLVESRFDRGASQEWTNYDFERPSVEIEEVTGVMLSITTLKRIFGKVKYNNSPSTVTLNALAKYAGFADWGEFKSKAVPKREEKSEIPEKKATIRRFLPPKRWYWWVGGVTVLLLLLFIFLMGLPTHNKTAVQDPSAYSFSSNTVLTTGVPNSVIFNYNAKAAGNDSVFITQSWDVRRRKLVSKNNNTYSSIYYYPGFFRAKLIVGDKVMKHHDLLIASSGWLAAVEQPEAPIYFKKEEFLKDSMVIVTPSLFEAYHLALQPHMPTIRLFDVLNFQELKNDNFTFETTLKNGSNMGNNACKNIEILILCKNDAIIIPLCSKGCVGDLSLYAAGRELSSSENDLSGFGCDPTKWVTLRVESINRHIRFIVNGKEACSLDFPNPPSDIIGVEYYFKGPSEIKTATFSTEKKTIKLLH